MRFPNAAKVLFEEVDKPAMKERGIKRQIVVGKVFSSYRIREIVKVDLKGRKNSVNLALV